MENEEGKRPRIYRIMSYSSILNEIPFEEYTENTGVCEKKYFLIASFVFPMMYNGV